MNYLKWAFRLIFLTILFGFLHYTLPTWDTGRVVGTEIRRQDIGERPLFWAAPDSGHLAQASRDVRFIEMRRANGRVLVFRNEDTGWGWPPYFKINSSDLQAEASDLISPSSDPDPQWVAIKHYGWRSQLFSIYPNAVRIKEVAGPHVSVTPWTSIGILVLLAAIFWGLYVRWRRFWAARIDPVVEDVVDRWEGLDDDLEEHRSAWRRMTDWITGRQRRS